MNDTKRLSMDSLFYLQYFINPSKKNPPMEMSGLKFMKNRP